MESNKKGDWPKHGVRNCSGSWARGVWLGVSGRWDAWYEMSAVLKWNNGLFASSVAWLWGWIWEGFIWISLFFLYGWVGGILKTALQEIQVHLSGISGRVMNILCWYCECKKWNGIRNTCSEERLTSKTIL